MSGLILAAPSSGSGKTTITLALLRALKTRYGHVCAAKSGPDYIDPQFHAAAGGSACVNLDAWAMSDGQTRSLAAGPDILLIEGAMGLFDGAPPDGRGASADLARILDLPVVLIVDASRMAQSVAPLVSGFAQHDPRVHVAGVILNKLGSSRHEAMLRSALKQIDMPVLGAVHRHEELSLPSRHLGLVQASEMPDLEPFLERAAEIVSRSVDLEALLACANPRPDAAPAITTPARSRRMAIAHDLAYSFTYQHLLSDWRAKGCEITTFSPLNNDAIPEADLVFLPGGYPELHAEQIAKSDRFLDSLRYASQHSVIYGECGGYMTLGETLTDAQGKTHKMAGLLQLQTSFAERKLHLGYRDLTARHGPLAGSYKAHEFHYSSTIKAEGTPLFEARDAEGRVLPPMGLIQDRVLGSFAHIINPALPI